MKRRLTREIIAVLLETLVVFYTFLGDFGVGVAVEVMV
jgi:hypothetical protein